MDLSKIRHVQPLDPVSAGVTSQPTQAIELRLRQLEDLVLQLTSSQALSQLIIYNVPAANDVGLHSVVYFDPNSNVYALAQAQVTLQGTTFDFTPSAIAMGIVVKTHGGQLVDILVGGYDLVSTYRDAGSNSLHFLEDNETFQPGVPYYLSAKVPGKLTRFAPAFKIQVIVASNTHFVVAPSYSNPDAVENTYPLPIGMRPVGALRPLPPGNDHVQIVGFDALEKVSRSEPIAGNPGAYYTFNEWRITKFDSLRFDPSNPHAGVPAHLNFGYMVADAAVSTQPSAPVYVGLQVAQTTGVITACFSKSLLGLFDSGNPDCYVHDMIVGQALLPGNFSTVTRTLIVTDQANIALGTLSFCFTDPDVSTDRMVVFEFPTSFQGWKMLDAPETPAATCALLGSTTAVDPNSIMITSRGYGYSTAPAVIFSDPPAGGGATTALGHAVLDERGRVAQIVVDNAGLGYATPPVITITGRLQSVAVTSGGSGFLTAPTLLVSGPDDPVVFEQATVGANMVCNIIESVDRVNAGIGYTSVPAVVQEIGASAGNSAAFTPILTTNAVVDIPVLTSGTGYQDVPTVTITGAHGAPASATAIMKPSPDGDGMAVDYIRIDDGGNGYSGVVTATLTPLATPTTPATLDVGVIGGAGAIQEIDVTSPGAGYSPAQALVAIDVVNGGTGYLAGGTGSFDIIFTGGSTNATGKARVTAGVITSVDLLSRGTGYTGTPGMDTATNGGGGTGATLSARLLQFPLLGFSGGGSSFATFTVLATDISSGQLIGSDLGDGLGTRVLYPTTPGSGYDPNFRPVVVIDDSNGTGAQGYVVIDPGTGAVQHLVITQPGTSYDPTSPPSIGLAWGKDAAANPVVGGYIASVDVINPGKGYSYPPAIQIGSGSVADSGGAVLTTAILGDGGSRSHYRLQVTRFNEEPNMSTVAKPAACDFYYNAKADPNFSLRWPPVPIDKATFVMNGVEVTTTKVDEGAGAMADPNADVGLTSQTLFWSTSHADGCPWDQFWEQYRQLATDADSLALINGTFVTQDNTGTALPDDLVAAIQWYWWERLSLFEGNRNCARLYINQLGRLPQIGKVASLSVMSPLKLIDLSNGVDSRQSNVPMTGHLQLMMDNQASFLADPSPQVDLSVSGSPQVIYQNNTGKKVYISSFLIETIYQRVSGTAPMLPANTAKITIGTQRGSYRDLVGMLDPIAAVSPGADACLTGQGQFKELLPDSTGAPTIVLPGESVYLSVLSPAGGPVVSQIVTVRTRGYAY